MLSDAFSEARDNIKSANKGNIWGDMVHFFGLIPDCVAEWKMHEQGVENEYTRQNTNLNHPWLHVLKEVKADWNEEFAQTSS